MSYNWQGKKGLRGDIMQDYITTPSFLKLTRAHGFRVCYIPAVIGLAMMQVEAGYRASLVELNGRIDTPNVPM